MIDLRILNPFLGSVVTDPWRPARVDVSEIHAEAFNQCCQAIDYVKTAHQSTSIIIHGEAGSGKTHLMARLRSTLNEHSSSVFISVPLQTSPHMLWRHVRRCLVDDLLRPTNAAPSQLKKIATRQLESRSDHFDAWLSQVRMDHDLSCILNHLLQDEYRRETRAWLRGDPLNETDLTNLGLPVTTEDEEAPEDKARRVTLSLCKLFGPDICLIFCFDQVEALQNRPEEKMGLSAFGRMIQALHDGTSNALLISCMQSNYVDPLYDAVEPANKDRLASYGKRSLLPLKYDQALSLISARLEAVPELTEHRQGRSRLWPLKESDIKKFFASRPVQTFTAREIIATCAQLFEAARGRPPEPVLNTADFLEQEWQKRLSTWAEKNGPEDFDHIIQHGLPQLFALRVDSWQEKEMDLPKDIDLIFSQPKGGQIEVSLCNHQNMSSLAARLKRLLEGQKKGKFRKLILMRDPRWPIKPTAKKTNDYLFELKKLGVRLVHPPLEILAAVDALRVLLSEARAGDLAFGERSIEQDTLRTWLDRNIPSTLQNFADDLAASGAEVFPDEALLALLEEQPLVKLSEAAARIERSPRSLEAWVRKHPGLVGFLYGPPALLFQVVPDSFPPEYPEGPV